MFPKLIVRVLLMVYSQVCLCASNESGSYVRMDKEEFIHKSHRFINFNTDNSGDITIELAFNVPFITIPTNRAVNMTKGALAKVHLGSVVLSAAIIMGTGFAIPAIQHFFATKGSAPSKVQRSETNEDFIWNQLNTKIQQVLEENELDSISCIQRMICWAVKNSITRVSKGTGTSKDKILDGIVSNEWFKTVIQDSIFYQPLKLGQHGGSCAKAYSKCKITQRSVQGVMAEIMKSFNI